MTGTKRKANPLPDVKRYQFLKPLGSGGMGTVHAAFDRFTGSHVAVKVLHASLSESPTLHMRLAREFKSATKLEHPNIVRALDFGTDGKLSYLVFELVAGESLGVVVERHGPMSEVKAVRVITQMVQALQYAHHSQVVHRDVKPDNILMLQDGRAKLTDFGLAKDFSDNQVLTQGAKALGTPHYMAPEQFADARTVGPAADVYSLSATLYTLLTGRLPFDAKGGVACILANKEAAAAPSVRAVVPEVSERVDAAIRAALAPNPDRRPATCLDFFRLLTARQDIPTEPLPLPGSADRRCWVRHPLTVGGAGGAGVLPTDPFSAEWWPVAVQDLSAGGVGFLLARRYEVGTVLMIELPTASGRLTLSVQVVRVTPSEFGHWAYGCAFARPLTQVALADALGTRVKN